MRDWLDAADRTVLAQAAVAAGIAALGLLGLAGVLGLAVRLFCASAGIC